ncbi:hypothetical protein FQR65_LT13200 [Abscondita terminalis]|nr:hypothetical protein FQR65_LT13200 [Abscondita terminalis]
MNKLIVFAFVIKFSQGLECYNCDSMTSGSLCQDPLNTDEIQATVCDRKVALSNFTTDFECLNVRKFDKNKNIRIYERRCQQRNYKPNYCSELEQMSEIMGMQIEKCDVCYTDRCNSSSNVRLSLLLNLIFFYIFFECTKF